MGKKGFTLVELLGVVVLLGIVITVAVTSVGAITNSIKKNMLNEKVAFIEESATLFGEDIKGSIMSSDKKYNNYPCKSYIVSDLIPEYLDKDNDNTCLDKNSSGKVGCIVDPTDQNNYLDKYEVIIYFKNKRIHSKVDIDNNLSCS